MKVRILSGNQKGAVKDLPQIEAENALATGFAELVDEKKDQAELDKNMADVPDVSPNKAEKMLEKSPGAVPDKGKTGKATPKPKGRPKK
jgi:hypothetical protein